MTAKVPDRPAAPGAGDVAARDAVVELSLDLLARPSITPADAGCQATLAARLRYAGFETESLPFGDVTNLWARRGTTGPVLVFAGHTDVVPPGNADGWQSDPFRPEVRDGRLYARGAADMKCSLAAMIVATERYLAARPGFAGSIAFLVTSDEEGAAVDGTRRVVDVLRDRREHIDWCVVGEPSSHRVLGDTVRIGRRGSLTGLLTVDGVQGHVAYPDSVDNPVARFAPVLAALHEFEWDRGNEHFPPTSFQMVSIECGSGARNVTPSQLRATFNFRYSTEWDQHRLQQKVHEIFQRFDIDYRLEWRLSGEPFLTRPGRLIDAVVAAVRAVTGAEPELSTGGGTSDGRFIAPAGIDVVELGPVNETIHKVNENILVDDLPGLVALYEQILVQLFEGG